MSNLVPKENREEFNDYCSSIPDENIFEHLEDQRRRESLAAAILAKTQPRQTDLFGEERLETILSGLDDAHHEGDCLYQRWTQQDKVGKARFLGVPNVGLKRLIDLYILPLVLRQRVHPKAHGCEPKWSVTNSVSTHLPCRSILTLDLASAFQNVTVEKVFSYFYSIFSDLPYEARRDAAGFLAMACTVGYAGSRGLPQGSPLSPPLFNRMFFELEEDLDRETKERGLTYSRWLDDLAIGSPEIVDLSDVLGAVKLVDSYAPVSRTKVFFQREPAELYVLGHIISRGKEIRKNSREEAAKNKIPIDFDDYFGQTASKRYESWRHVSP